MSQLYPSPELPSSSVEHAEPRIEAPTATVDELVALCNFKEESAEPTPRTIIDSHADVVTGESIERFVHYAHKNDKAEAVEAYTSHLTDVTRIRSAGEVIQLTLTASDENNQPSARYKQAVGQSFALLLDTVRDTMEAPDTSWPPTLTPLIENLNGIAEQSIKVNNLPLAQSVLGYSEALGIKANLSEAIDTHRTHELEAALLHRTFGQALALYVATASGNTDKATAHTKAEEMASLLSEFSDGTNNPRLAALRTKTLYYIARTYALTGSDTEADYYVNKARGVFETDNSVRGWVPNTIILALGQLSHKSAAETSVASPDTSSNLALPATSIAATNAWLEREAATRESLRSLYGPRTPRQAPIPK